MVMDVHIADGDKVSVPSRALFDPGSQFNLISIDFAKRQGWKPVGPARHRAEMFEKVPLELQDHFHLTVRATDSAGVTRDFLQSFYSCKPSDFDIVLGSPWCETKKSGIYEWTTGRWWYGAASLVDNVSATELEAEGGTIYSCFLPYPVPSSNTNQQERSCTVYGAAGVRSLTVPSVPVKYHEFADVFNNESAAELPRSGGAEHAIDTTADPPFGPLYSLSEVQLRALRDYLQEALAQGWITHSVSPAGAPILFVPKKDGGLRLCVDYRGLNKVTVKNRHPLPLINETLDRLVGAKRYTKLDLKDAYHRIRIKAGDEWKTAFRTRYGHFEYRVMPFGLANAPATFQAYINKALHGLLDDICVVYLDDILIYSHEEERHEEHVRRVLERLQQYSLFANLKKCVFDVDEVEFLGFIVGTKGVSVDRSRIETIAEWPQPKTFREVQQFLGFANFYRRFILKYSKVVAPMTDLLVGSVNGKKGGPFVFPESAQKAFEEIKRCFEGAPVLHHFNPELPIVLETDASGRALAGIISQPEKAEDMKQRHLHPVAFWSRKMTDTETRYPTYDQELLAIVKCFKQWRHYLEGSRYLITVMTDHNNLRHFMTTKELNGRQVRWAMDLSAFDFEIKYRPGKTNPADAPSRRPDYAGDPPVGIEDILPTFQKKMKGSFVLGLQAKYTDSVSVGDVMKTRTRSTCVAAVRALHTENGPENPYRTDDTPARDVGKHNECKPDSPMVGVSNGTDECSLEVSGHHVHRAVVDSGPKNPRHEDETSDNENGWIRQYNEWNPEASGHPVKRVDVESGHEKPRHEDETSDNETTQGRVTPEPGGKVGSYDGFGQLVPRACVRACTTSETVFDAPALPLQYLILDLQSRDVSIQKRKRELETGTEMHTVSPDSWRVDDIGLLRRNDLIVVPHDKAIREELLRIHHDDPLAGHFGPKRTRDLLGRKFFWEGMMKDVEEYIQTCVSCQQNKPIRHRPYGVLASLPFPTAPWKEITMDFITGLPVWKNNGVEYDSILVVVDRFTKMARYLATTKTIDSAGLADIIVEQVIRFFGIPDGIVTDRGSVFTSSYWSNVCYYLKVTRKLTTAFHPQTDGQTERQNQTLEAYLRAYCNEHKDNWGKFLSMAEFAYNNSKHATTGISPFRALYGYDPSITIETGTGAPDVEVPSAGERIQMIHSMREKMAERWQSAVDTQAHSYNRKHKPMNFKLHEWVWLSTKNIRFRSGKLTPKLIGPFEIVKIVGTQSYKLRLPPLYERLHPVFHVSLLEPYRAPPGQHPTQWSGPELAEEEGEEEWEVETILDHRSRGKHLQYLVRWKGWPPAYDQWVNKHPDMENSRELIAEYHASNGAVQPARRKRGRPRKK
jgi:hypothetical protein